jgi:hypothetical protein
MKETTTNPKKLPGGIVVTKDEFKEIARRIESTMGKTEEKFTDLQFEEWWDSFKDEDYDVGMEAYKLMRDEYGFFPFVATFRAYIQRVKENRDAERELSEKLKAKSQEPIMSKENHKKGSLFNQWLMQNRKKLMAEKRYPQNYEQWKTLKAEFQEKYPNWQPKKEKEKKGVEPIGDILKREV